MRVLLLGTGSADGWPNPFCQCASCTATREQGIVRGQTAALVDEALLLDCGPEAPRAAARAGRSLHGVRAILLTHAHPDHLGPAAALWRTWAHADGPLTVAGPPSAVTAWRDWVAPDADVTLAIVAPGDRFAVPGPVGDYDIRVLAAAHDPRAAAPPGEPSRHADGDILAADTVLFDVTGPDGARLLYAPDTGPLPLPTLAALRGAAYDLILLDLTFGAVTDHGTGHLDFGTFPRTLAALRSEGAATDRTDVVAIHLGHGNPAPAALDHRLAAWGARVLPDLAELVLTNRDDRGEPAGADHREPAPARDRSVAGGIGVDGEVRVDGEVGVDGDGRVPAGPGRRTLLLGGARSGKSAEAERLLAAHPRVRYLATGPSGTHDPEWRQRVAAHRARRPETWTTVETLDVAGTLRAARDGEPVLVDCLTLWLSAQLDAAAAWPVDGEPPRAAALARVDAAIADLVDAMRWTRARVVLVSNEVGLGIVPATPAGRLFRDLLGRLNAAVAAVSDDVALLVAGTPVPIAGGATAGGQPVRSTGRRRTP